MRKSLYLIILLCALLSPPLHAQDNNSFRLLYIQAENDYHIGRIEQAENLLEKNLELFSGTIKISAYRLLALCKLADDDNAAAERYVNQLLNENPYYSVSPQDPQRFIDMVETIKAGRSATITTASNQAESLGEVPVPTTLITAQMIRDCGGRNLQEVLAAYVPGMSIIDCNDDINIAMRGVYSNGQEKILIMLNGHRLNSYCTNIAAPDFSISLEKIKQIEVLRGPASSLYGGVSLTAVVNIITWQGADIDGVKARGGVGNYGQIRADVMLGKRYFDLDLLLWGSIYKSEGEKRYVDHLDTGMGFFGGDVTLGRIGNKPTYDAGLALKYNNIQFLYNTQFSQVVSPMSMMYLFSPYDISKYRTFNGIKPSFATMTHHASLAFSHQLGKLWLKGSVTYDNSELTHYQVISEKYANVLNDLPLPSVIINQIQNHDGIYRYINGQEQTIGGKLLGDWNYVNNPTHKGQLTFGAEYNYFHLDDVRYVYGVDYTNNLTESDLISNLGKGHENLLDAFVQFKHHWRSFIVNAGLRFDYKIRFDKSTTREFSPRIALIYLRPKWNLKLSYSKAFIDAPYLYRKTNMVLMSYVMMDNVSTDLTSETLHSWQLTFGATQWLRGLNFELNAFFNRADELLYQVLIEHENSGVMHTHGLELSADYQLRRLSVNVNATWQNTSRNRILSFDFDRPVNTPVVMANATVAWRPINNLQLHSHLSFYGNQQTFYLDIVNYSSYINAYNWYNELILKYIESPTTELEQQLYEMAGKLEVYYSNSTVTKDIDARLIADIGAIYTLGRVELGFDVSNLLNTHYSQSGMSTGLIPQKGRWFMASLGYKF